MALIYLLKKMRFCTYSVLDEKTKGFRFLKSPLFTCSETEI